MPVALTVLTGLVLVLTALLMLVLARTALLMRAVLAVLTALTVLLLLVLTPLRGHRRRRGCVRRGTSALQARACAGGRTPTMGLLGVAMAMAMSLRVAGSTPLVTMPLGTACDKHRRPVNPKLPDLVMRPMFRMG